MAIVTEQFYQKDGACYRQLVLRDGDATVTLTPAKGGMITGMTLGGEEYSWLRENNFERAERPRCGVPVLFPSCGSPKGGVHHFGGKAYPMENHGFADLLPWEVESIDGDGVTLSLQPNGLTKFVYPFDFDLAVTYALKGSTVTITTTVGNTGSEPMPFSLGFHPYFAATALENVSFDIKAATCADSFDGEQKPVPAQVELHKKEGADNSVVTLRGVQSPMVLTDQGNGHKVTVAFDEAFGKGVLWQQDAERFVCMEPWNGWANSLNEEGAHEVLAPGEYWTCSWSITMEKV